MAGVIGSKRFWLATLLGVGGLLVLSLLIPAQEAAAHPLGNFSVNRYSGIELEPAEVRLHYVLDLAEIPTFQERDDIDANGDGTIAVGEREAYLGAMSQVVLEDLALAVDGEPVGLTYVAATLSFAPGQGGLETQRIDLEFAGDIPAGGEHTLEYSDETFGDRIGWREIVVRTSGGVSISNATAPAQSVSDELRAYPEDSLDSPPDTTTASATFAVVPGAPASAMSEEHATDVERAVRGNQDPSLARYAGLVAKDELSLGVVVLGLLAAVGFGAVHALSPGHGKTIVAAYLVGSRRTWRHALLLALTVTVTHTSSVYALGFVTLYFSQYIVPETLYPWLGIISGAIIVTMGLGLLVSRLRHSGLVADTLSWLRLRPRLAVGSEAGAMVLSAPHSHAPTSESEQSHEHSHGFGHSHAHVMPGQDGQPVSIRGLVGLGIFGGLLPCPSAIVVMLSAIALHRVAFGLLLIVAFSVGLAGVLTAIGFALVFAGSLSDRIGPLRSLQSWLASRGGIAGLAVRAFPVGSAAAVFTAGLIVLLRALSQQGML